MNGLMISINNKLDKFCDVFIAEMGAFRRGEIKEKCQFIKPQYGIITTIGKAHLESFGSIQNTQKAKFELIDSLPDDGIGVLSKDDELLTNYNIKTKAKIYYVSMKDKNADLYAYDIKLSDKGTSFKCKFKNEEEMLFETKLLGRENIYNILEAMMMSYALGLNLREISLGVKRIKPVEHRLELREYDEDITIIDDAYNSNPVGSKMAVEVLSYMPGKKIIITPGMIELGEEQEQLNKEFGYYISEVCDEVILIGLEQTKPIYEGLKEKKFKEDNIFILNDVKKAFPLMEKLANNKKTFVLIENDLPDIFNE
jgi:UDP-N-acetylmuramoyl-tripeptide--D-alanyl-D-alanine ligase